ncbi:FG-GAP-like repeat-containing protein [Danxiaibacter flavus]|uniref:FG-GAP-like repeat-containing protein n=1 Tax=Danxiaibacter flavus TaxID=3049108 RepID=A0ABV3ZN55_9BACT|nr:FG-GAP-like repeat-containing protein [Chitinophagaceae bacterium DXS]
MTHNTIYPCAVISRRRNCLLHFIRNFYLHAAGSLKRLPCLIASCFFLLSASGQAPVITNFTPFTEYVNKFITINGNNFSPDTTANAVYIGGSRARVTSASTTSLTVQVLPGATSDFLRVTTNGLTGYSKKRFLVFFSGLGYIAPGCFHPIEPLDNTSANTALGDLDGDGMQDMAVIHTRSLMPYSGNLATVSLHRNVSGYTFGFDLLQTIRLPEQYSYSIHLNDLDRDGKTDLVISPVNQPFLLFYKNNSTPGNINFNAALRINVPQPLNLFRFLDMDGDGKEDLVMTEDGSVKILLNKSTNENILYARPFNITFANNLFPTAFADMNADGKTDIVISPANTFFDFPYVQIIKNDGTPGLLSFNSREYVYTGLKQSSNAKTGDMDLDGLPEIVVADNLSDSIAVLKNKSPLDHFSFETPMKLLFPVNAPSLIIRDVDGDNLSDIVGVKNSVYVMKNTSNFVYLSYAPAVKYSDGTFSSLIDIKDMNGDGQPDIAVGFNEFDQSPATYILKNQMNVPAADTPRLRSFFPKSATTNDTIVISGYPFRGITEILLGNTPVKEFTINSTTLIFAIVGDGSSGNLTIKNLLASDSLPGFTYKPQPTSLKLISTLPYSACKGEEVKFKVTIIRRPPNSYYRWFKNNVQLPFNGEYRTRSLKPGDKIWATLFVNNKPSISSDTITVGELTDVVKPTIKIVQSTKEACKSSPVKFTAVTSGGGNAPSYQWYKNNMQVGTNSASYVDTALKSGDSVFCVLNVAEQCAIVPVASKSLGIIVYNNIPDKPSPIAGLSLVNPGQTGIQFSINPVDEVRTYRWQIPQGTSIVAGQGTNTITMNWGNTAGKISIGLLNPCGSSTIVTKSVAITGSTLRTAGGDNGNPLQLPDLTVYPNPANSKTTVEFSGRSDTEYTVQLRDASGKLLQSQKAIMMKGRAAVTLNTANYLPGVYYVIVTNELNEIVSRRLLIGR